jgi:curved DNA-binding protein CbpA
MCVTIQFHRVNEANQVLKDAEFRAIFDEHGAEAVLFFMEAVEGLSEQHRQIGRVCLLLPSFIHYTYCSYS